MKKVILAAMLICNLGAAANACIPMENKEMANFYQLNIDSKLPYANQIGSGSVTVNYTRNTVTLTLLPVEICYHYMTAEQCQKLQEQVEPIETTLPIENIETTVCNTKVITAQMDRRPVDGSLEVLQVQDNRGNTCPTLIALAGVQVNYLMETPGFGFPVLKYESSFYGEDLQRIYYRHQLRCGPVGK